MTDWPPDRIRSLRERREQTQTAFGLDIYATNEGSAQRRVSDLERGVRTPKTAEVRTLERMKDGEV